MTSLLRPDVRLRESWAEAVAEFGDEAMHGSGLWDFDPLDVSESGCAEVVAHLLSRGDTSVPLPDGIVHSDYFWIAVDCGFVGYLALRHALTPHLLEEGGHIGFSVRPSRRREGHASSDRRTVRWRLVSRRAVGVRAEGGGARAGTGAAHLRRGQRSLTADYRTQRRHLRGQPQGQAKVLDRRGVTSRGQSRS